MNWPLAKGLTSLLLADFHYDITIKWPVKYLHNCDVRIELLKKSPQREQHVMGAFNNVAASLAASLDGSTSIERISRKARLAKMASNAKVF